MLEFACGTGAWTATLAKHASELTAIDASLEMLAIASKRVRDNHIRFIEADIFDWRPDRRYDVVFFSAWLSHVPPRRFDRFWALVAECLDETGRVFLIDELPSVEAHERVIPDALAPVVERPLRSGARYRVVKVFYPPADLTTALAARGWKISVHTIGWRFFYATASRVRS